jgi:hypothetical protein
VTKCKCGKHTLTRSGKNGRGTKLRAQIEQRCPGVSEWHTADSCRLFKRDNVRYNPVYGEMPKQEVEVLA